MGKSNFSKDHIARLFGTIKHPLHSWREYRDKKFAERIDRVYFHHDGNGNRFFEGQLHAVFDERTKMPGGVSSSAELNLRDTQELLSNIRPRFVGWTEYYSRTDSQSSPEADVHNNPLRRENVEKTETTSWGNSFDGQIRVNGDTHSNIESVKTGKVLYVKLPQKE